jgi:hypothetical protein
MGASGPVGNYRCPAPGVFLLPAGNQYFGLILSSRPFVLAFSAGGQLMPQRSSRPVVTLYLIIHALVR